MSKSCSHSHFLSPNVPPPSGQVVCLKIARAQIHHVLIVTFPAIQWPLVSKSISLHKRIHHSHTYLCIYTTINIFIVIIIMIIILIFLMLITTIIISVIFVIVLITMIIIYIYINIIIIVIYSDY